MASPGLSQTPELNPGSIAMVGRTAKTYLLVQIAKL